MIEKERAALKLAAEIMEKNHKKYFNYGFYYGTYKERKRLDFDEALDIINSMADQEPTFKEVLDEAVNDLKKDASWIPVTESLPDSSRYILLSFENYPLPAIGRCETDEDGNSAFYLGDDYRPLVKIGVFVNAWMELPEQYHD